MFSSPQVLVQFRSYKMWQPEQPALWHAVIFKCFVTFCPVIDSEDTLVGEHRRNVDALDVLDVLDVLVQGVVCDVDAEVVGHVAKVHHVVHSGDEGRVDVESKLDEDVMDVVGHKLELVDISQVVDTQVSQVLHIHCLEVDIWPPGAVGTVASPHSTPQAQGQAQGQVRGRGQGGQALGQGQGRVPNPNGQGVGRPQPALAERPAPRTCARSMMLNS